MTPSGPNNQSFLLRIAPTSPQVLEDETIEDLREKCASNGQTQTRPSVWCLNRLCCVSRCSGTF